MNIDWIKSRRQAIAVVREEANALIEQAERRARGWDRGAYRDDDCERRETIAARSRWRADVAFKVAQRFA